MKIGIIIALGFINIFLINIGVSLKNELIEASIVADFHRIKHLLSLDPAILSPNHPIIAIDAVDDNFGRSATLVSM